MSHSDFHKIFVISLRSFVALFAFVSAGAEAASWAYIESVEINRSSNIVSIYSFKRGMYPIGETGPGTNFVDQLSQIYLYNVYATVTVKNDGDDWYFRKPK